MGWWLLIFTPTSEAAEEVEDPPDECLYHPPRIEVGNEYRGRIETSNEYRTRLDECE